MMRTGRVASLLRSSNGHRQVPEPAEEPPRAVLTTAPFDTGSLQPEVCCLGGSAHRIVTGLMTCLIQRRCALAGVFRGLPTRCRPESFADGRRNVATNGTEERRQVTPGRLRASRPRLDRRCSRRSRPCDALHSGGGRREGRRGTLGDTGRLRTIDAMTAEALLLAQWPTPAELSHARSGV
jgi:hypothetical protein